MLNSMPGQESPDALLLHSHAAFRLLMLSYENTWEPYVGSTLFIPSVKPLHVVRVKGYKAVASRGYS